MRIPLPSCVARSSPLPRLRRNHGAHFEKHKTAFEEGGGRDEEVEDDEAGGEAGDKGKELSDSRAESIREDEKRVSDERISVVA